MFAGGLVVARAHPGPRREVVGGGEAGHVAAGLGDEDLTRAVADAGDGDQQLGQLTKGPHAGVDLGREPVDGRVRGVDAGEHLGDEQRVVGAEASLQRVA